MNQHPDTYRAHFHIRWEHKQTLDWECFRTHSEATARAAELAGPNEIFTIVEVSGNCPLGSVLRDKRLRPSGSEEVSHGESHQKSQTP